MILNISSFLLGFGSFHAYILRATISWMLMWFLTSLSLENFRFVDVNVSISTVVGTCWCCVSPCVSYEDCSYITYRNFCFVRTSLWTFILTCSITVSCLTNLHPMDSFATCNTFGFFFGRLTLFVIYVTGSIHRFCPIMYPEISFTLSSIRLSDSHCLIAVDPDTRCCFLCTSWMVLINIAECVFRLHSL